MGVRGLGLLCAAVLLVPSCGGGGSDDDVRAAPASENSGDVALAEAALLDIDDFSQGWREEPRANTTETDERLAEVGRGIQECDGIDLPSALGAEQERTGQAKSPTFLSGSIDVEHTVNVFASSEEAASSLAGIERAIECVRLAYSEFMQLLIRTDPDLQQIDEVIVVAARWFAVDAGDESIALQVVMTLQSGDSFTSLYLDVHGTRVGRAVSGFVFIDVSAPLDGPEQERLVRVGAKRLAETLRAG